jgi:uncharacterized SAM-binding protein YcdF (DUF218 family)
MSNEEAGQNPYPFTTYEVDREAKIATLTLTGPKNGNPAPWWAEAEIMGHILRHEFGIEARWQEAGSMDTAGNAALSAPILKAAGIQRIVLVTHAFHMPRARLLFERAGLEVIPAPTAFFSHQSFDWLMTDFLPQAKALHTAYYALHEWLGMAWIALNH